MTKESRFGFNRLDRRGLCVWSDLETSKRVLAVASGDVLELVDVALSEVRCTLQLSSQITCLDWRSQFISVGLVDGTVLVYDGSSLHHNSRPIFSFITNSPITAISVHPQKPGLFACATSGSAALFVCDVASQSQFAIEFLSPLTAAINALVWNPKAAYILAVGTGNGVVAVVDIRDDKRREIVRFLAPSAAAHSGPVVGCAGIVWVFGNAAQLISGFTDGSVCVFDVGRPGHGPVRQFALHPPQHPLLSMEVCRADASLVLTTSSSGGCRVWAVNYRDLTFAEFAVFPGGGSASGQHPAATSGVQPGAVAFGASDTTAEFLEVRNICEGLVSSSSSSSGRKFVPQWLQKVKSAGGVFGFGGRFAVWGVASTPSVVEVSTVTAGSGGDEDGSWTALEEFVLRGDLAEYVTSMQRLAGDVEEQRLWRALTYGARATREQVVAVMDVDVAAVRRRIDVYLGRPVAESPEAMTAMPGEDVLESVFDQAARRSVHTTLANGSGSVANGGGEGEELLREAIRLGDVASGVEIAVKIGLWGEALYLASAGDRDLLEYARGAFVASGVGSGERRMLLESCMSGKVLSDRTTGPVGGDVTTWKRRMEEWSLEQWREAVVVAALHGPEETWKRVLVGEVLGERLHAAGWSKEAAVCWAIGGAAEKLIDKAASEIADMTELIRRVVVIRGAINQSTVGGVGGGVFASRVKEEFVKRRMENEGEMVLRILSILNILNDDMEIRILKDRIIHSNNKLPKIWAASTGKLWDPVMDIRPDVSVARPVAAASHYQQHPQALPHQQHQQQPQLQKPPQQQHQYQPQPQHTQQQQPQQPSFRPQMSGIYAAPVQPPQQSAPAAVGRAPNQPLLPRPPTPQMPQPLLTQTQSHYQSQPVQPLQQQTPPSANLRPPIIGGGVGGGGGQFRGPVTTGGSSTAPQAGAVSLLGGLPTPWPVPTAAQAQQWTNAGVVKTPAMGIPAKEQWSGMGMNELGLVRRALDSLMERTLAMDGNRKKYEDAKSKMEELYGKLERGEISPTVQAKLIGFGEALEGGDSNTLAKIKTEIQSWDWDMNKSWIMAIKLIYPRY